MRQGVNHHADASVDEFLDLLLFGLGGDAGRDDAGVVQRLDKGEHVYDRRLVQRRLSIVQHAFAGCPDP